MSSIGKATKKLISNIRESFIVDDIPKEYRTLRMLINHSEYWRNVKEPHLELKILDLIGEYTKHIYITQKAITEKKNKTYDNKQATRI